MRTSTMRAASFGLAALACAAAEPALAAQSVSIVMSSGGSTNVDGTITLTFKPFNEGTGPINGQSATGLHAIVTVTWPSGAFDLVSPFSNGPCQLAGVNGWLCGVPSLTCGYVWP